MNIKYNVTEGTKLNITVIVSRAFTTNFNVNITSSLLTATSKYIYLLLEYVANLLMLLIAADFDILSSNVIFDSSIGQETVFAINIIDDTLYEPKDSLFMIMLVIPESVKPLGVTLGENSIATISIIDNDS